MMLIVTRDVTHARCALPHRVTLMTAARLIPSKQSLAIRVSADAGCVDNGVVSLLLQV